MPERDGTAITRGEMGKFPREVADLVLHLVNTEGVRWRDMDKNHLLLYPPGGTGRPFKIGSARPGKDQVRFIERQFMAVYDIKDADGHVPGKEEEAVAVTEEITPVVVRTDGDPVEAVKTLAAALGVSLGGTVSEEDYLAVVTEKDVCAARAEALDGQVATLQYRLSETEASLVAITEQRDHLLSQVTRIAEITTEAQ